MIDVLASDVAVTSLGAAGCVLYCGFLVRAAPPGALRRATLWLVGLLGVLLTLRAFYWSSSTVALGRAVFAAATLLPLVGTLFVEQLLRRHHPLWMKVISVAVTSAFFVMNLAGNLASHPSPLFVFVGALAFVLAANAWLLTRVREKDLSRNEWQVVRGLLFAAILAVPLAVSDFRTVLPWIPARLGALGALLCVYVLLSLIDADRVTRVLIGRLLAAIVIAGILATVFALVLGFEDHIVVATVSALPAAMAVTLLGAIMVRMIAIDSADDGRRFLRWLLHARLDSLEGFLHSLKRLPLTAEHLVLRGEALSNYSLDALFELDRREPLQLSEARAWVKEGQHLAVAEQVIDLLERYQMTHILLISQVPPSVMLINLPEGTHAALGQSRLAVIQRLARRMAMAKASI